MSGVIPVSISNKSLDFYKNQVFQSFLDIEGLTEIAVNRPGEIWTEINGDWTFHNNDSVTFDFCKRFSHTLASFREMKSAIPSHYFQQHWNQENVYRSFFLLHVREILFQSLYVNHRHGR